MDDALSRLVAAVARRGIRPKSFLAYHRNVFRGVSLAGKTVVDVGSGLGLASCYAAARGAVRVVSVEPQADGSPQDALERARSLKREMPFGHRIEIVPARVEESSLSGQFDIVVISNAINHFNEEACAVLHREATAQETYRPLFEQLANLCKTGGTLIVTDCSNRNFFDDIGLVNPVLKTINWRIHQPPEVWARLLSRFGFRHPRTEWMPLTRMGWAGRLLGTRRWVAYLINSHFRLVMEKASAPDDVVRSSR
jgi:SAM-dependent methyltransferase